VPQTESMRNRLRSPLVLPSILPPFSRPVTRRMASAEKEEKVSGAESSRIRLLTPWPDDRHPGPMTPWPDLLAAPMPLSKKVDIHRNGSSLWLRSRGPLGRDNRLGDTFPPRTQVNVPQQRQDADRAHHTD